MSKYFKKYMFMFGMLFFASGLSYLYMNLLPYKTDTDIPLFTLLGGYDRVMQVIVAIGVIGYFAFNSIPKRELQDRLNWPMIVFWVAMLLFTAPFAITNDLLGTNEMEPILIFFKDNQFGDIQTIGTDGFKEQILKWAVLMFFLFLGTYQLLKEKRHAAKILALFGLILFLSSPFVQFISRQILPNEAHQNFEVTDRLYEPVILKKPAQKKNLVVIYLESLERSYGNIPEFGHYYQPVDELTAQGQEYTNVHEVAGTNYTIAGMVAGQCGVPLLPNGLLFHSGMETENDKFMPSIRCLGDVLSDDEYTLSYMNGASADKFSKRIFYKEHGYSRIFDKNSLTEKQREGRSNVWGINDALLFEHLYQEYNTLKATGGPFALSLLTLSTHGPNAFLDNDCTASPDASSQLLRAIQCTAQLVSEFVDYIEAQGDSENTVVVVQSDHLALFNSLRSQLASVSPNRRNLFMMLGTGAPDKINRPMTPFDYYPTILEGLGYTLKDGRANFGVAASSGSLNLMEDLGKGGINKTFKSNQNLANYLWREDAIEPLDDSSAMELASN